MPATLSAPHDDARRLFVENANLLEEIAASVARRHALATDEVARFGDALRAEIAADDYARLRQFRGRSTLRTYLLVIAEQLCRARRFVTASSTSRAPRES